MHKDNTLLYTGEADQTMGDWVAVKEASNIKNNIDIPRVRCRQASTQPNLSRCLQVTVNPSTFTPAKGTTHYLRLLRGATDDWNPVKEAGDINDNIPRGCGAGKEVTRRNPTQCGHDHRLLFQPPSGGKLPRTTCDLRIDLTLSCS